MQIRITLAQIRVSRTVADNKANIINVLNRTEPNEWIIFPEGALSGYFPGENSFLRDINGAEIDGALGEIVRLVGSRKCFCLLGSALCRSGTWYNSAIFLDPLGPSSIYHKRAITRLDSLHFQPGSKPCFQTIAGTSFGVVICREIMFPNLWSEYQTTGAQIVFHLNNAINQKDQIWEHLLIARAVENGFFSCSVNDASPPQTLPSFLVAPSGRVLIRSDVQREHIASATIDLDEVVKDFS